MQGRWRQEKRSYLRHIHIQITQIQPASQGAKHKHVDTQTDGQTSTHSYTRTHTNVSAKRIGESQWHWHLVSFEFLQLSVPKTIICSSDFLVLRAHWGWSPEKHRLSIWRFWLCLAPPWSLNQLCDLAPSQITQFSHPKKAAIILGLPTSSTVKADMTRLWERFKCEKDAIQICGHHHGTSTLKKLSW